MGLAAVAAGVSVLTMPPVTVQAATAAPVSSKPTCAYGEITGSGNSSNEPISTRAGQNLVTYTTVRNAKSAPLSGVFFDYQMVPPSNHKGAAPTVWWKFNGGSWHHLIMTWHAATKSSTAQWVGGDAVLGNLPGSGATLARASKIMAPKPLRRPRAHAQALGLGPVRRVVSPSSHPPALSPEWRNMPCHPHG